MKIIHCADIHADAKMGTHYSKEESEERRREIVDSFENMVNYAKNNDVKIIIIAGDLFDSKETYQKKIKQRIGLIIQNAPQIDFLYLRGNHDENVVFPIDVNLSNLKKFNKENWTEYSYENVRIYGREFESSVTSDIYSSLDMHSENVNIVIMHGQIVSYKTKAGAPEISLSMLKNKNIDYLALGHIHSYKIEKLDNRGIWCYSGTLEGRGFDECGPKGFVLLDIQNNNIKTEFIPIAKRTIHEIKTDISGCTSYSEIMNKINNSTSEILQKDIVKIVLAGEVSDSTEIEVSSYKEALLSRFYLVRLEDKTQIIIDYEKYEKDISLKGEFIRLVKEQTDLSDEQKAKIIVKGIRALYQRSLD